MRARRLGGTAALTALLIARPVPAAGPEDITVFLMNTGADLDATAKVRLHAREDGAQRLELRVRGLPPGIYDVLADGNLAGTLTADGAGTGALRLDKRPLPFDPRGTEIEIADRAAKVYFCSVLPESEGKARETIAVRRSFARGGVVRRASGTASYRSRGGKIRFDVKVKHLPAGTYRLFASNEPVADITVVERADGSTAGQVKLDSRFARRGRRLLTLDPLCEDLALREAVDDETADILIAEKFGGEDLCY
jgi:hypothetical protein